MSAAYRRCHIDLDCCFCFWICLRPYPCIGKVIMLRLGFAKQLLGYWRLYSCAQLAHLLDLSNQVSAPFKESRSRAAVEGINRAQLTAKRIKVVR